jgi:hypothetical protein
MKRYLIAAFVAGLVVASGAAAGIASYWEHTGLTYKCRGTGTIATCKETNWQRNYSVWIMPGRITVDYGSNIIFTCNRKRQPAYNCTSFVEAP